MPDAHLELEFHQILITSSSLAHGLTFLQIYFISVN